MTGVQTCALPIYGPFKYDGFDEAIIGPSLIWRDHTLVEVLVYDAEIMRQSLMRDGMTSEEAREFLEFNYESAYIGPKTPVMVWTQDYYGE